MLTTASAALAFSGIDHSRRLEDQSGRGVVNFFITKSTIKYEFDEIELDDTQLSDSKNKKIERTILGLTYGRSLGQVDLVGSLGYVSDGEFDDYDVMDRLGIDYDWGLTYALGARVRVADYAPFTVHAYGQVQGTYEKWIGDETINEIDLEPKLDLYTYELAIGGLG